MHTGEQYHQFILSSPRDRMVRDRFQKMALALLPEGADVLDFGAGTGIDAKVFAANGHRTFVYEPSEAMRTHLAHHCSSEITLKKVVEISSTLACKVDAVTANFAVLNHFSDHTLLFEELSRSVHRGGFVLASMLSPYYLSDARYDWWRKNLLNLVWRPLCHSQRKPYSSFYAACSSTSGGPAFSAGKLDSAWLGIGHPALHVPAFPAALRC